MSCGRPLSSAGSTAPNYPTSTTPARRPCAAPPPAPSGSVCVLIWFNVSRPRLTLVEGGPGYMEKSLIVIDFSTYPGPPSTIDRTVMEETRWGAVSPGVFLVDSYNSRRFPPFHLKMVIALKSEHFLTSRVSTCPEG